MRMAKKGRLGILLRYRMKEYRESGEKIEKFRNWRTGSY